LHYDLTDNSSKVSLTSKTKNAKGMYSKALTHCVLVGEGGRSKFIEFTDMATLLSQRQLG